MAHGGVHEPPGRASQGLIAWAIDTWPYVNDKALIGGMRLEEMEASDMLDVLHFIFEEDFTYVSEEQAKSKSGLRTTVYDQLYGTKYSYPYSDKSSSNSGNQARAYSSAEDFGLPDDGLASVQPFSPSDEYTSKPYVPPTKMDASKADPFGGLLDAPLG